MINEIKKDLPNIPEEVISLWILPLAKKEGWPPSEKNQWDERVTGELFSFWNNAEWEKVKLDLSQIEYSRSYSDCMRGLEDAYLYGIENNYWEHLGENGKKRFQSCYIYILKNRNFPKPPIICPNEQGQYDVLDGNHRFLSFVIAERACEEYELANEEIRSQTLKTLQVEQLHRPRLVQEVWICRPNWDNSSNAQTRNYLRNNGLDIFR